MQYYQEYCWFYTHDSCRFSFHVGSCRTKSRGTWVTATVVISNSPHFTCTICGSSLITHPSIFGRFWVSSFKSLPLIRGLIKTIKKCIEHYKKFVPKNYKIYVSSLMTNAASVSTIQICACSEVFLYLWPTVWLRVLLLSEYTMWYCDASALHFICSSIFCFGTKNSAF